MRVRIEGCEIHQSIISLLKLGQKPSFTAQIVEMISVEERREAGFGIGKSESSGRGTRSRGVHWLQMKGIFGSRDGREANNVVLVRRWVHVPLTF